MSDAEKCASCQHRKHVARRCEHVSGLSGERYECRCTNDHYPPAPATADAEKCKYRYPSVGGVCNQAAELHRGAGALSHPFTPAPATSERDEVERYNCVKFHRDECGNDCSCACHGPAPEGAAQAVHDQFAVYQRESEFAEKLRSAINQCSQENGSNTPDFILTAYLVACLDAFNKASREREAWYGKSLHI